MLLVGRGWLIGFDERGDRNAYDRYMFPDDLVLMACSKLRMATRSIGKLRGQLAMMASMIVSNVSMLGV